MGGSWVDIKDMLQSLQIQLQATDIARAKITGSVNLDIFQESRTHSVLATKQRNRSTENEEKMD